MNPSENPADALAGAFAVGKPVLRKEDPVLVRGRGRYVDDVDLPGQLHAAMVRSTVAHGVIKRIDIQAALAMPGVRAVYTADDLDGYGELKCLSNFRNRDGTPMRKPVRKALARGKVRFVGDPVAMVVAETLAAAQDASEAVGLDLEHLPAVTRARDAFDPGAPQLYDNAPRNLVGDYYFGDEDKVAEAFANAHHVTRLDLINNRVVPASMETRGILAQYDDGSGRFTVRIGCQGVFGMRNALAEIMGLPKDQIRVVADNVGGSFGMKNQAYPEYVGVLHAARALGRPVKWVETRSNAFLSDQHGRDHEFHVELALDQDGGFLAIRAVGFGNMGAYLSRGGPNMSTRSLVRNMASLYRVPVMEVSTKCVLTNTPTVSAYRGAGRPEANYYMERLVDAAAREMGIDRIELRRRNLISPESIPFRQASGEIYDSGDFPALLDTAIGLADLDGFAQRRDESRSRGKIRGLGVGCYLEVTALPTAEMAGIRFGEDGIVTLVTGTLDYGQGHATPFAQTLAARLGIPFENIRLLQGDSDELIGGGGTGGSRSMYASGQAIAESSDLVIAKGTRFAADLLEVAEEDIEFARGRFGVVGTDRSITILDLAKSLKERAEHGDETALLDVHHVTAPLPATYPNGVHVAEIEIDPDLGIIEVVKYLMVNDFGTIINPMLVEGQLHGGVMQGIGQALMERVVFDDAGQILTGSFMDYAMPRAEHAPPFRFRSHPSPARTNALGVKGCGEAGCAGALTSVMNAVTDALLEAGAVPIDMPATPEKVWKALAAASERAG